MGKNRISKTILLNVGLVLAVIMLGVGAFFATRAESGEASNFVLTGEGVGAGDYVTADGAHKISVATDEGGGTTIAYFDTAASTATYALTASTTTSAAGVETTTLIGNLGTDSKAATFVMLNENAILCVSHISYATASGNVILYGYTPFVKTYTPTADANGVIEVWRNGSKVSAFANFQDAFTSALNNDTIKLNNNLLATEGAALVGKNLTIDGNNYILDKSEWANTVFAVAEDAQLTINNLNIDGGATGWNVNLNAGTSGYSINFSEDSNDPTTNYSAITSSGKLLTNNLNISNVYSTGSGAAITIAKGEASISNSTFSHLRSSIGGAILVGFEIQETELSDYTITNVTFNNVDFTNNYAAVDGGAVKFRNVKVVNLEDCNFDTNVANSYADSGGGGGALHIGFGGYEKYAYGSTAHKLGLSYSAFKINNSIFSNNWVRGTGPAILNGDAEIEITNTDFISNISTYGTCFGAVTHEVDWANYTTLAEQTFDNCLFENNVGDISGISDTGGTSKIAVKNTSFKGNKGGRTIYFNTAVASIDNCTFENEEAGNAVIDVAPLFDATFYQHYAMSHAIVEIKDVEITNTIGGVDVRVRKNRSYIAQVNIEGTTAADVDLENGSTIKVNGTLDGSVTCDPDVPSETSVTVTTNGSITGGIVQYYNLTINYTDPTSNTNTSKTVSLRGGTTTTSHEIEALLNVSKDNHTLVLYTDSACTTAWDYNCDGAETLYGNWEWAVNINYYDQGGIRFSGTYSGVVAQRHLNGTLTVLDTPTKDGYIFGGWYLGDSTCSDESKIVTQLSASQTYTSVSLYAKWNVFVQTVTLSCQNLTTQQFMVYVFIGDELVMQIHPTANMTLTFNRLKNYDKALRICFVYGYYGKIEYTSLTGANANGRNVNVLLVETVQINYKITTPNVNSSIIV